LSALDRLGNLSKRNDRISNESREALRWLDEITSSNNNVHLQGGFEVYDNWSEVEKFLLPDTLLSQKEDETEDSDNLTGTLADLHVDDSSDRASVSSHDSIEVSKTPSSPLSSYSSTSPDVRNASPYAPTKVLAPIGTGRPISHKKSDSNASNSTQGTTKPEEKRIPYALRPFFNHIVWRVNQEQTESAIESWIVLSNDPLKQTIAQRFGIRAKRLEQLREIIAREEREYRNRMAIAKKENHESTKEQPKSLFVDAAAPDFHKNKAKATANEDDGVLKKSPPKHPRAMIAGNPSSRPSFMDPNTFGRNTHSQNGPSHGQHTFPRGNRTLQRGRGGRAFPAFNPKPQGQTPRPQQPVFDPNKPIDPDSFGRPPPARSVVRGGRRALWEPS